MYQIVKNFRDIETLCTLVNGNLVALNREYQKTTPASSLSPDSVKAVPLATQEQLKQLFEEGCPCVEHVPDAKEQKPQRPTVPIPTPEPA
jgi:hypothetical protein